MGGGWQCILGDCEPVSFPAVTCRLGWHGDDQRPPQATGSHHNLLPRGDQFREWTAHTQVSVHGVGSGGRMEDGCCEEQFSTSSKCQLQSSFARDSMDLVLL